METASSRLVNQMLWCRAAFSVKWCVSMRACNSHNSLIKENQPILQTTTLEVILL